MRKFLAAWWGSRYAGLGRVLIALAVAITASFQPVQDQRDSLPANYPQSLEGRPQSQLSLIQHRKPDAAMLTELAEVYMDLADDLLNDDRKRQIAYETGAKTAKKAFGLDDWNARAHFLYAANLGSAERLKGLTNAAMNVREITQHMDRAIQLNPRHDQALQVMGGLRAECCEKMKRS